MKHFSLCLVSVCISLICCAQNAKTSSDTTQHNLIISLIKNKLTVTDKDQPALIANLNTLDSLIKKLPNTESLSIHFQSENADPEKIKEINGILNKCHCHVTAQHVTFANKPKTNK